MINPCLKYPTPGVGWGIWGKSEQMAAKNKASDLSRNTLSRAFHKPNPATLTANIYKFQKPGTIWYLARSGRSGTWHDQIWYLARSDNYSID